VVETTAGESAGPPPQHDEAAREEALAPVLERLAALGERSSIVQAFARSALRRVTDAQLRAADPASVAAALADAFAFVDRRRPGYISVRLTDPDVVVDGSRPTGTVVEVACEDRRFIVSTVAEELHRLGYTVVRSLHPVFGCERGAEGPLAAIIPARTAEHKESFLQAELAERVGPQARLALVQALRSVLVDVFAATRDEDAMRDRIASMAAETRAAAGARYPTDDVVEAADFLDWLLEDNFVIAGCGDVRTGATGVELVEALGMLADPDAPLRRVPPDLGPPEELLRICATAQVSTVHRQVPMHRIEVARVGAGGEVAGVSWIVGVLSRKANSEPSGASSRTAASCRR
jgi:glutamate dehydrogenase